MTNPISPVSSPASGKPAGEAPVVSGQDKETVLASVSVEPASSSEKGRYHPFGHSIRDNVGLGGRLLALIKSEWKTGVRMGCALYTVFLVLRNLRLEQTSEVAIRGCLSLLDGYESRILEDSSRDKGDRLRTIRRAKDAVAGELRFVMNRFRLF